MALGKGLGLRCITSLADSDLYTLQAAWSHKNWMLFSYIYTEGLFDTSFLKHSGPTATNLYWPHSKEHLSSLILEPRKQKAVDDGHNITSFPSFFLETRTRLENRNTFRHLSAEHTHVGWPRAAKWLLFSRHLLSTLRELHFSDP